MVTSMMGLAGPPTPDAQPPPTLSLPPPTPKPPSDASTSDTSSNSPPLATASAPWPRPYYIEDGLRRVAPYHFTYNTWCKQRWRGRSLLEVFASEFRDKPLEYYKAAMISGQVRVNDKLVGPDYILQNGDLVSHTTHRHEPPITAEPIRVIFEDDDMMVINKPSGVPVHPAGRYSFNSVVEILKSERGQHFLPRPCNRLDRLTSGIMFIAKNPKAAGMLSQQIEARRVRKEYLARVVGRFPDGDVVCDQPILSISPKLGLNRVRANGKHARSVFKRLAYYPARNNSDGDQDPAKTGYSIVRCLPVTGRTHQLRVHLQYLGHPISNDPIYANSKVWGFDLGSNDPDAQQNSDEDIISRLSRMGKEDVAQAVAYYDEMVDGYEKQRAEKLSGERCAVCDTPLYTDPGAQELSLYLHSLRYEDIGGEWGYVSPMPSWALPPDGLSGPTEVGGMDDLVGAAAAAQPVEPEPALAEPEPVAAQSA
ncbi:pseudouridine synthase [Podospora aff. communis PSN243]|uniref:Pseudouridine synthase n=1 Tax=Podospora aff. communis PSN243 TaxID=3040156 RepID=A0AAV9GJJ5_9PEZI|nr:pseudouridine synthase [Podospora aff. communis PSN243]